MRDSEHDNQVKVLQQMYGDLHHEHGETPMGVGWGSRKGQYARFHALLNYKKHLNPHNILDVGCGYGGFFTFVRMFKSKRIGYTGIDIVEDYIEIAKTRYPRNGSFQCRSVKEHAEIWGENAYDLVVGSGVVGWWNDPFQPLTDMWYLAKKCMAFNWHEDTSQLTVQKALAFAEMVGCSDWTIQHDYLEKDYTVHMYKDLPVETEHHIEPKVLAHAGT